MKTLLISLQMIKSRTKTILTNNVDGKLGNFLFSLGRLRCKSGRALGTEYSSAEMFQLSNLKVAERHSHSSLSDLQLLQYVPPAHRHILGLRSVIEMTKRTLLVIHNPVIYYIISETYSHWKRGWNKDVKCY